MGATFVSSSASRLLFAAVICSVLIVGCGGGVDEPVPLPQARAVPTLIAKPGLQATASLAKTGETVRDFSLLADDVALVPPYAADAAQTIRVRPSAAGASVSVVHWGDGESSVVPEGWNAGTPEAALSHRYAGGDTYQVEYANKVDGAWDSRLISLTIRGGAPPPAFPRGFSVLSGGSTLADGDTVAVGQTVSLLPSSDQAAVSVVHWGDGTDTTLPSGWRGGDGLDHAFAATGRYAIEYATLSPRGSWDGRVVTLNVSDAPPPGGTFLRAFILADEAGRPLTSASRVDTFTLVQVRDVDQRATASVIHWGDGASTVIQGGVRADTAPWLLAHAYTQAGTFTLEYATVSPDTGTWDSRVVTVVVSFVPPAAPPGLTVTPVIRTSAFPRYDNYDARWQRASTLTSHGSAVTSLGSAIGVVSVGQDVTYLPPTAVSTLPPVSSTIQWGDGETTEITGGWRPVTPLALTTHRYAAAGSYQITYAETAPDGSARQATVYVDVLDQPVPPVAMPPRRAPVEPIAPTRSIHFFGFGQGAVRLISTDFATGATTVRDAPELLGLRNFVKDSVVSPDARFVLSTRFEGDPPVAALQAFRVEKDLSLTPVGTARSVESGDIALSPTGRTLYVFSYPLMIHAYAFDSGTGLVGEKIGSFGIAGGDAYYAGIQDAVFDPTGQWMLARAPDWPTPSLAVIRLDPATGAVVSQRRVVLDHVITQFFPTGSGGMLALHPGGDWLAVSGDREFLNLSLLRFDRSSGDVKAVTRIASQPRTKIGSTYNALLNVGWGPDQLYLGATYAWQSSYDRAAGGSSWFYEVYQSVMNVTRLPFDATTGTVAPTVSTQWLQARPRYVNEPSGYYKGFWGGNTVETMLISPTAQSVLGCQWSAAGDWGGRIDLVSYTIAPGNGAEPWLTQRSLASSQPPAAIAGQPPEYCQ
jgi:hypothetical protein